MSNEPEVLDGNEIRQKIEDYATTIYALQSFVSLITWDMDRGTVLSGSHYSFGRRMDTSAVNRVSPNETVTPDAVIQKTPELGYIVEAKKSLPENNDYWSSVVDQLIKYDDDLLGWWTEDESLEGSNVILLVEISRAAEFARLLEQQLNDGSTQFNRPTSVIEFTKSSELKEFIFIRKQWGRIEDEVFDEILELGKKVPIEKVLGTYGSMKFYDAEPVVEHTMVILWQDLFTQMKSEFPYDEEKSNWLIDVSIEDLTQELRQLYGASGDSPRDFPFPRNVWIRRAMDALVDLGYAEKKEAPGEYVVLFKRLTGDVLERFTDHREIDGSIDPDEAAIQTSFLQ